MCAAQPQQPQHDAVTNTSPSRQQQHRHIDVQLQAIEDYRRFAAVTIQRYCRGWIVRLHKARQEAAQWEQKQTAEAQHAEACRLYVAARMIQDAWRSYRNKRIYRFYRDLIKFREAADPRQLLRCINAPEAALVDAAAGLHIRFRLGGSRFPPLLLYKVFTHRPVTDICAFGPRNYAAEAAATVATKPTAAAAAHPHKQSVAVTAQQQQQSACCSSSSPAPGRSGWYCRDDRNGWRPVVELQQQLDGELTTTGRGGGGGATSSTSSSRHRQPLGRRSNRRSRLQLAHGANSGRATRGDQSAAAAAAAAAQEHDSGGYSSEPELQAAGSGRGSPCAQHGRRQQQQHYHHSPLVRRAEHAQRLKQRRRQWLLKMYRAGMRGGAGTLGAGCSSTDAAAAAAADSQASSQVDQQQQPQLQQLHSTALVSGRERETAGSICKACTNEELLLRQLEQELLQFELQPPLVDTTGSCSNSSSSAYPPGGLLDAAAAGDHGTDGWDVEQLLSLGLDAGILAWAQKLDFDSYQRDWGATAVMLGSEAAAAAASVASQEAALKQQLML